MSERLKSFKFPGKFPVPKFRKGNPSSDGVFETGLGSRDTFLKASSRV